MTVANTNKLTSPHFLPTCLPTGLLTCLPTCLPALPASQPAYVPTLRFIQSSKHTYMLWDTSSPIYLPACLPAFLPACALTLRFIHSSRMSSMRLNCEYTSTRWPPDLSFSITWLRSSDFPDMSISNLVAGGVERKARSGDAVCKP